MVLLPRNSPKSSFGLRGKEQSVVPSPGPAHYNSRAPEVTLRFSRQGASCFGTSVREGFPKPSPGPGQYTAQDIGQKMRSSAPKYTCSPRLQAQEKVEASPAPVDYSRDAPFAAEAPKYSIATPRSSKDDDGRPGPAHYVPGHSAVGNPILRRRRERTGGFGSEERMKGPRVVNPGPGQYSMMSTLAGPSHKMAPPQELPPHSLSSTISPGPGVYSTVSDFGEESYWQHVR